jgi:glycosyltransferase involved in cell wall biosynthesis
MSWNSLPTVSIIITTYNRPVALHLILLALTKQTQLPHEVIIADDGSGSETAQLISHLQYKLPYLLKQVWQPDQGFQAAKIRNKAVLAASADYLIFLDGDCVPFPDFVKQHQQLAEMGWFVSGHRILLNQHFSEKVLAQHLPIYQHTSLQWLQHYFSRHSNKLFPLVRLRLNRQRKSRPKCWKGVKSCNLGIWQKDFLHIKGFDESFIGWGYEDSDLVIRLIRSGILRKSGKFAVPVIHLWHPQQDRKQEPIHFQLLDEVKKSSRIKPKMGVLKTRVCRHLAGL